MPKSLGEVLEYIFVDVRLWQVLEDRVDKGLTLEQTGINIGNITRERIRQLEQIAARILISRAMFLAPFIDPLEKRLSEYVRRIKNEVEVYEGVSTDRKDLIALWAELLESSGYEVTIEDVQKLTLILRALVFVKHSMKEKSKAEKIWPHATYLACNILPRIMRHQEVAKQAERENNDKKNLPYKEILYQILCASGEPLHWSALAERVYQQGHRSSFSTTGVYNALQANYDIFVRIGPGTYGLVEWGMSQVVKYSDIIASVLEQEQRALPADTIFGRVNMIRLIKKPSLLMTLDMHPRFYKSIEDTYGLRSWLSPREEQTVRTPEWLVEDPNSFVRLERAVERGYKVEDSTK